MYKGSGKYSINSCETIEMFYNLRTDLDKLNSAVYITKIINDVTTENQNSYKVLQLYLNTLYAISQTDKNLNFIISVFRLRLLSIIGYKPNVRECASCKGKENLKSFSFKNNGFLCEKCGKQEKGAVSLLEATSNAIKYIILADAKKIFSFNLSDEGIKELEIVSKIYLNEKLEKEYKLI